nr:MAG TPA: hypothetical protein [Caudoviricetes sp.]DAP20855.1 MAG TPA: hypothetical protein [Bacteriophage sp.]DAU08928.1 MAG TPA: hypothetical protein [Caudoviricetes sp.]
MRMRKIVDVVLMVFFWLLGIFTGVILLYVI